MKRGVLKLIFGGLVLSLISSTIAPAVAEAASLRDLLKRQTDLQQQAEESRKKAEQKKREAADLQETISQLDEDITATQNRINNAEERIALTNQVIDQLSGQIAEQQTTLEEFQNRLKTAYVGLYELSQTSTLEVILQSQSLSELVSHTQYVQAIQNQLQSNITQVNTLIDDLGSKKAENERQKSSLEGLHTQLASERTALNRQKQQKDTLFNLAQGEQNKYENLVKKLESEQETLSQEIYEARRVLASNEQVIFGSGGYPWVSEPNPYAADPWLFIKRQCTSYAAWKFLTHNGAVFYNTRPGQGSAWNWPALARDQGYETSSSPSPNSVVSWPIAPNMPYGHVAWVTGVNNDGTINLTEYNWVVPRGYSERYHVEPARYGRATYIKL